MFLGSYHRSLDDKGRVLIPPKFRGDLAHGLVLTRGQERCLYAFPAEEFSRLAEQLRQAPISSKQARDFLRIFLSGASDELLDGQGRLSIPHPLRVYAGLRSECALVGVGQRVEFWARQEWESYVADTESSFAEQAQEVIPGLF